MTTQTSQLNRAVRQTAGPATPAGRPGEEQLRRLMTAGLDGHATCHAALLRAVRPLLLSFFARRIGSGASDLEDLVQEVLVAIHERRASYDRGRPFTPWLFAVARYKLIDRFRRTRIDEPIERLEDMLASEGFAEGVEARIDVTGLLATLPAKQALAIRLTRLFDMSVAEAAKRAGISESDVKVSSHRGMRALSARVAALVH